MNIHAMGISLATIIALAAGTLGAQTAAAAHTEAPDYTLAYPPGWDHWVLANNSTQARAIWPEFDFAAVRVGGNIDHYLKEHQTSGDLRWYPAGLAVHRVSDEAGVSYVESEDGAHGWIVSRLLIPTAETETTIEREKERKKVEDDSNAARVHAEQEAVFARAKARRIAEDADREEELAKLRIQCRSVFRSTVNRKLSDLTVGETQQVGACQALGMYQ